MKIEKKNFKSVEVKSGNSVVQIFPQLCKGCELCVYFCPKDVLAIGEDMKVYVKDEKSCIGCFLCQYHCPDFAIFIYKEKKVA